MMLDAARLGEIADRADLLIAWGDPAAIRAEDIADLLAEVRELRADNAHLRAVIHREWAARGRLGHRPRTGTGWPA